MNKIIIDTDPGIDDACAIALAARENLRVAAITTVFGNSSVKNSVKNSCVISDLCDLDVPIYKGASRPLKGKALRAKSHGEGGLAGYSPQAKTPVQNQSADWALKNLVDKHTVIAALGPLTNIAKLIKTSDTKPKEIVFMGGVFDERGNTTPFAEFNAFNDPVAMEMVVKSDIRTICIPANICRQITLNIDEISKMVANYQLAKLCTGYVRYYREDTEYGGYEGAVVYDALVIAYVLWPELFDIRRVSISINREDGRSRGQTKLTGSDTNSFVVSGINNEKLKGRLLGFV